MKSLYEALVDAGVKVSSHYSDLYFPSNETTRAILKQFPLEKRNTTTFVNQVEGGEWFDTPFAYMPYWDAVSQKAQVLANRKEAIALKAIGEL